jgi:hypothetical protein
MTGALTVTPAWTGATRIARPGRALGPGWDRAHRREPRCLPPCRGPSRCSTRTTRGSGSGGESGAATPGRRSRRCAGQPRTRWRRAGPSTWEVPRRPAAPGLACPARLTAVHQGPLPRVDKFTDLRSARPEPSLRPLTARDHGARRLPAHGRRRADIPGCPVPVGVPEVADPPHRCTGPVPLRAPVLAGGVPDLRAGRPSQPAEYLDELPFPRSELPARRRMVCDYCFFGGPSRNVPLSRVYIPSNTCRKLSKL